MIHQFGIEQGSRFTWAVRTLERLKLANPAIQTVFDIGSGNELLRHQIETMGLVYRSFDMSPQNTNVQQWNIEERFPYPGTADVLVCLEIIEHLNNPWLGMRNVSATLATGGHLIMTTPNPSWSESRLHLLSAGVLGMFTEDDLRVNHHVFTPWKHIVNHMLLDNGFEKIDFAVLGSKTKVFAHPFWGLKLPLRVGFRLTKKLIESLDGAAIGSLYGVLAQKKGSHADE